MALPESNQGESRELIPWLSDSAYQLLKTILPKDYPDSVAPSYGSYVRWSALGMLTGRVQSVLATQAALFSVGLGAGAIPMAAAVQWILKDGVGYFFAIVYASSVNTRFDADAKRFRFQSTCLLTFADFVAVIMPLWPQLFFVLASFSSSLSSIANVAQVSSRPRITSVFAQKGNLADCTRAGMAQSKLMSLSGTLIGAAVSSYIGPDPFHILALMFPLAAVSLYAIHTSSALVVFNTFNTQRAERAFASLLDQLENGNRNLLQRDVKSIQGLLVPCPEEVSQLENFITSYVTVLPGELRLQLCDQTLKSKVVIRQRVLETIPNPPSTHEN